MELGFCFYEVEWEVVCSILKLVYSLDFLLLCGFGCSCGICARYAIDIDGRREFADMEEYLVVNLMSYA